MPDMPPTSPMPPSDPVGGMPPTAPMPGVSVGVQIVFYGPNGPETFEDSGILNSDGSVSINFVVQATYPPGTGVQVTAYLPSGSTITLEGCTVLNADGTTGLDLN